MAAADRSTGAGETSIVAAQIGRTPRGEWRVSARCSFGFPQVVETAPLLDDGTPFPTLYWLTCPFLVRAVGVAESDGVVAAWAQRLAGDPELAERQMAADSAYRSARALAAGGEDPCRGTGVAGLRDALATKCLHAHTAAYIAGIDDPAGAWLVARVARECQDSECSRLASGERRAHERT